MKQIKAQLRKYMIAIPAGMAVTLALLFAMTALIDMQPGATAEARERYNLAFVRVPPREDLITARDELPEKDFIEPPMPPMSQAPSDTDTRISVSVLSPLTAPRVDLTRNVFGNLDGGLVPIVRVSPTYPARAQAQGLEGWVLVQFDVLATGSVTNVRVIDSSSHIFEKAAVAAAARFRYKPQVIDGVPRGKTGLQNIFRFHMEKDKSQ